MSHWTKHELIEELISLIGDDPNREGLKETPERVIKSFQELFSGYNANVQDLFKTFEDVKCNEMVILRGVEFISFCEHHILPFVGVAHIAYIPNGKVIGISKLARLLEVYTRRLQIQERICEQVTTAMDRELKPKGSACVLEAKHLCMCARGVNKQNSEMITSSLTGVFFTEFQVRTELLNLIRG
jgi:GTP cyclohydrolase IA